MQGSNTISLIQAYRLIFQETRGYRAILCLALLMSLIAGQLAVAGPTLTASFFEIFQSSPAHTPPLAHNAPESNTNKLMQQVPVEIWGFSFGHWKALVVLIAALATILFMAFFESLSMLFEEKHRQKLTKSLKLKLYEKTQKCHVDHPQRPTGELMTIIAHKPTNLLMMIPILIIQPLTFGLILISAVITMMHASIILTTVYLICLTVVGLILPLFLGMDKRVNQAGINLRNATLQESNVLQEQLSAREMIDSTRSIDSASKRAELAFIQNMHAQFRLAMLSQVRGMTEPLITITFPLIILVAVFIGESIETIMLLLLLYSPVRSAAQGLFSQWGAWRQSSPELSLLSDELNRKPLKQKTDIKLDKAPGITLCGLQARLPDGKCILNDVHLEIDPGEMVGIIGRGGTGKSLLIDVIAGRFPGQITGKIGLDNKQYELADMKYYRSLSMRVNQFPELLKMSVAEYIGFGVDDLSPEEVTLLLDEVGLGKSTEQERRLEPDDMIGTDRRLSGFQRQALRLAAILARPLPKIILLDEPDSSMSAEDARHLQLLIQQKLAAKATVIMVTHAPQLLPDHIRLIYLRDGGIEDFGTHEALIQRSTNYRKLIADIHEEQSSPTDASIPHADARSYEGLNQSAPISNVSSTMIGSGPKMGGGGLPPDGSVPPDFIPDEYKSKSQSPGRPTAPTKEDLDTR